MSFISGPTDNFSGAGLPDTTPTATAAYMDILRGLVGSGQTFALGYAASLIIDNPQTFFGRIDVDTKGPMIIALGDLTATSYSFNGSELVLYNNNTPIDRLALTDPNPDNLVAFNATGGVAIVTKGFLSGESVPLLPMHMGA